jgi:hypothetical protein
MRYFSKYRNDFPVQRYNSDDDEDDDYDEFCKQNEERHNELWKKMIQDVLGSKMYWIKLIQRHWKKTYNSDKKYSGILSTYKN